MGATDLAKVAVNMAKVIRLLSEEKPNIKNGDNVYEHKEDFYVIAYICRVGILDLIEKNTYMQNPFCPIKIPTGLFSVRKETIGSGLKLTVESLKEMVSVDVVTSSNVGDILEKRGIFYECEKLFGSTLNLDQVVLR